MKISYARLSFINYKEVPSLVHFDELHKMFTYLLINTDITILVLTKQTKKFYREYDFDLVIMSFNRTCKMNFKNYHIKQHV